MAIQFDPNNRVIMLDSFNVSASTIWSRWLDWSVLSDNLKYLPAFSQVGGVAPIPLYLTLGNGWKVRVQEADGTTKITGNLLTSDGLTPFAPTLGAFNTQVILESPIAAQAIEVNTGSGLTAEQAQMLADISIKLGTPSFDISTDIAAVKSDTAQISSLNDFDPVNDTVANVANVAVTVSNSDMRGTDGAMLAASYTAPDNASVTSILADTNELQLNQGSWLTAAGFATPANITDSQTAIQSDIALLNNASAAENADALLNRNLASGLDGGRTVKDALRGSRNRTVVNRGEGTITVYQEDDTTVAWQGSITTETGDAIGEVDPA